MAGISGLTSTWDYSSLFSSLSSSGSNSSTSSTGSSMYLSDYASIKNGSYSKLLKAYYAKNDTSSTAKTSDEIEESAKTNSTISTDAKALKSSADALIATGSNSVFNMKEMKDENGNKKTDYDYDAIYKAVKSFADNYNNLVSSAGDSDSNSVLRKTLSITNGTKKNANLLSQVGVSIGEDNKLTVDEKTLKAANINDLKALFSGVGSYAYNVSSTASMINSAATNEIQKLNTYTSTGAYSYSASVGKIYDGAI
ncbi:MAG: hypothetical protein Q4G60_09385 [bacterium]|nr:hypothetical protein [bacterium]